VRADRYQVARALQAFRDGRGDIWDHTGALVVADGLDDMRVLRMVAEGMAGVKRGKGVS